MQPRWGTPEYSKHYREHKQHPLAALRYDAKRRALNRGRPFDITLDRLLELWPVDGRCVYCEKEMKRHTRHAPSLDEILVGQGYVDGNVSIICRQCNSHKNDHSAEWFERIARRMREAERTL